MYVMAMNLIGIDHVEVFVRNIAAAQQWYARVLGLVEVHRWSPEPVMIGAGATKLALFRSPDEGPRGRSAERGWYRVAWRTDGEGFIRAQEQLRRENIGFRGPVDHGVSESIYFEDPDGNLLEVTSYRSGL